MQPSIKPIGLVVVLGAGILLSSLLLKADEGRASGLSKKELANAQNIHWWTVKIPSDLVPNKDMVNLSFISSDGKEVDGMTKLRMGPSNSAPFGPLLNVV